MSPYEQNFPSESMLHWLDTPNPMGSLFGEFNCSRGMDPSTNFPVQPILPCPQNLTRDALGFLGEANRSTGFDPTDWQDREQSSRTLQSPAPMYIVDIPGREENVQNWRFSTFHMEFNSSFKKGYGAVPTTDRKVGFSPFQSFSMSAQMRGGYKTNWKQGDPALNPFNKSKPSQSTAFKQKSYL